MATHFQTKIFVSDSCNQPGYDNPACCGEKSEVGERHDVEGKFGEGKQTYGLSRILDKRQDTSEIYIHLAFTVMNVEKRMSAL